MTELYHQLGYRHKWNLESMMQDGIGSGAIIGPRYISKEEVVSLPLELKQRSIFDPQFYIPNSSRGEFATYDFFPDVVANGFETTEWTPEQALQSASGCLEFQISNDFQYLVIPTRFREGMPSDYIESQIAVFIDPFLKAYFDLGRPKPCLLQLVLTDQMLEDSSYRRDLLNWITGLQEVSGVYLIYQHQKLHKQIEDIEFLAGVDLFVTALKQAGMIVIMGYLNTEAIPLLCSEPDIMTIGSYENMRSFSTLAMEESGGNSKRRPPNPRIYISRLLQWVDYHYLNAISKVVGDLDAFLDDSTHRIKMFEPTYKWHFSKSEPYRHYFIAFSNQFYRLASTTGASRVESIKAECREALAQYSNLEEGGVILDINSGGVHVAKWLTFLNQR